MAIDPEKERLYGPTEAAASLFTPFRPGKPTHTSRVVRLITKGVLLPDGSRLRLEALRLGSQWVTTSRCVREFGERLAAARIGSDGPAPIRTPKSRTRSAEQATSTLDRIFT